jgi:BirA family biotin operon repressor/biotin-[acetyl-CoA-carboxylase] ligase
MEESLIRTNLSVSKRFRLHVFDKIDSTNSYLVELGRKDGPEWSVAVAEEQVAGRGRMNRSWESHRGVGLWFSILLRPEIKVDYCHLVNLFAALSLSDFLEQKIKSTVGKQININVKWPNDLLVNHKKLCGILLQTNILADRVNFLVLGIGLNVNQTENDFADKIKESAVSLKIATQINWNREELLAQFLGYFYQNYYHFFPERQHELMDLYQEKVLYKNQVVTVSLNGRSVSGVFKGLTPQGYLILNREGEERIISTGEIV